MSLRRAVEDALNVMGAYPYEMPDGKTIDPYDPGYPSEEEWVAHADGLRYEFGEVARVLRAAIGLPIRRQKCPSCGAIDTIYWSKSDGDPPDGEHTYKCHACSTWIENGTSEWVMSTEANPEHPMAWPSPVDERDAELTCEHYGSGIIATRVPPDQITTEGCVDEDD